MSNNNCKRKKGRSSGRQSHESKILGLVLIAFGAITICAFLLPLKAWVILMSLTLLLCGGVLIVL